MARFLADLAARGWSMDTLARKFDEVDLGDFGYVLQYLRVAAMNGAAAPSKLNFHIELIESSAPSDYRQAISLVREIKYGNRLSKETAAFADANDVDVLLYDLLVNRLGLERHSDIEPRPYRVAYLRSTVTFLESWESLVNDDPNLLVLFRLINNHGSLLKYYEADEIPRRCVQRMAEQGYNTDYLVFGKEEILGLGATADSKPVPWSVTLMDILKEVVGSKDRPPDLDLGFDRRKFYFQIQADYELVRDEEDEAAGLRIIEELLHRVLAREVTLARVGDHAGLIRVRELITRTQRVNNVLRGGEEVSPQRLRAIRSPKFVPELLFDNTRLNCCLFKPSGLFHGEISRLLLDPATPMIEFWLDPYPEFLGLATIYPGVNAQSEPTILMDTIDYDDRLMELAGNNGTMRFILNAMVADARRARARKLLVFAAPYGKPINFANYVKSYVGQDSAVRYFESYQFESTDADDSALSVSALGRHHYTCAFGYDQPMAGVIDYGFNLVGYGSVQKLLTGGRGVYEIDLDTFVTDFSAAAQPEPPAEELGLADAKIHHRPSYHAEEIAARERSAVQDALWKFSSAISLPRIEFVRELTTALVAELIDLERRSFEQSLRYKAEDFQARMAMKGAELMLLRDDDRLVAVALFYFSPLLGRSSIYLDDLAVDGDYQSKGVGSTLLNLFIKIAGGRGYGGIYVLTQYGSVSLQLIRFYERAGFQNLGPDKDLGNLLFKPLSLTGPESLPRIEGLLEDYRIQFKKMLASPKVALYTTIDPQILQIVQRLETAFPESIRYTEAQLRERMSYRNAYIIVVYEQNEPVAFALCYQSPLLADHVFFMDSTSVRTDFQGRGIGRLVFRLTTEIPAITQYTVGLFFCEEVNQEGIDLVQYYTQMGAQVVDRRNGYARMTVPLRVPARHPPESPPAPGPPESAGNVPPREPRNAESAPVVCDEFTSAETPLPIDLSATPLEFLPEGTLRSLQDAGIHNVETLLSQTESREGRDTLAMTASLASADVAAAIQLAELTRAGVPARYLGALNRLGIRTLEGLTRCPLDLLRKVTNWDVPDRVLRGWQVRAGELEPHSQD